MKSKYKICKFQAFEHEGVEEYLKEQALKGLKLVSIGGTHLKFRKSEPEELNFSIEIIKSGIISGQNSEDSKRVKAEYGREEWNFICGWDGVLIFSSKKDEKPMREAEDVKFKKITRDCNKQFLILFLVSLLIGISASRGVIIDANPYSITSNITVIMICVLIGVTINLVIDFIRYIRFLSKAKEALSEGKKVIYSSARNIRMKKWVDKIFIIIYIFALVMIFIDAKALGVAIVSILAIGMLIISLAWKWIGKKNLKRKKAIMIGAYVIGVIFMIMGLTGIVFSGIGSSENKVAEKNLSSEDLGIPLNRDELYINGSTGILGSYIYYSDNAINYQVLESKYSWVINSYFDREVKKVAEFGAMLKELENYNGYKIEDANYFIINALDKVIIAKCFEEIEEDKIISLINERLIE